MTLNEFLTELAAFKGQFELIENFQLHDLEPEPKSYIIRHKGTAMCPISAVAFKKGIINNASRDNNCHFMRQGLALNLDCNLINEIVLAADACSTKNPELRKQLEDACL